MTDSSVDVKAAYERVCDAHDGIADFRAKLLALLPFGSGAGIFLAVRDIGLDQDITPHLIAVGGFGAVVTLGLFAYELRGIQKCEALIECARRFEKRLLPGDLQAFGAFRLRRKSAWDGGVGAKGAALLIYPAVFSAWIYVATLGAVGQFSAPSWLSGLVPGLVALASFAVVREKAQGIACMNRTDLDGELAKIEARLRASIDDENEANSSASGPGGA